jgi:hypothetical protein
MPTGSVDRLDLWTFSDAHVGTDAAHGRRSLADALVQSEGRDATAPPIPWDLALDLGDMSGGQDPPDDAEGREVVAQFGALEDHAREQVYSLAGNHDRNAPGEPELWWWQRWVDPLGANPECSGVDAASRPHPVDGTGERYSFRVGNVLFLMMSDINEPTRPVGRGALGGNPAGVVSGDTFRWWVDMVEANPDSIIVTAHHYVLKDTTVASGDWEGFRRSEDGGWASHYHGYKAAGSPRGASYLHWVDSVEDGAAFETYLAEHPGCIDLWLGGHTHSVPGDTHGGKSHIEQKWGVWFANVSALTAHHNSPSNVSAPMSRHWSFEGDRVTVRCYLHSDTFVPRGWYEPETRVLDLTKSFSWGHR